MVKGTRWNWCLRRFYPSWKSDIFLLQKTTWQKGTPGVTGCQHPAALQWNGSAATPCLLPGWPAETTGCICKTAQLRHLTTSARARQYQDEKTTERSLLFRLNNILKQIESNYNCLVLPDDLTPSVWISQEKKNKGFWKENYVPVRYAVENHKQRADSQVNREGRKSMVFRRVWRGWKHKANMVDSSWSEAKGMGGMVTIRHSEQNTNWRVFFKGKGKHLFG